MVISKNKYIYMKLHFGMPSSSPHDVCKLRCSLYGLKQAPQDWLKKFCRTSLNFSFTQPEQLFFLLSQIPRG